MSKEGVARHKGVRHQIGGVLSWQGTGARCASTAGHTRSDKSPVWHTLRSLPLAAAPPDAPQLPLKRGPTHPAPPTVVQYDL